MQSELSFLLELLLNHPLKTPTKLAIKARIEAVEQEMATKPVPVYPGVSIKPYQAPQPIVKDPTAQAPSTQRLLDGPGNSLHSDDAIIPQPIVEVTPPAAIVASPEAAKAMMQRKQAIAMSTGQGFNFPAGVAGPPKIGQPKG